MYSSTTSRSSAGWWKSDAPAYQGRYHTFERVAFEPKPVQQPIPIWVGGYGRASARRAARIGDAWHPSEMSPEETTEKFDYINRQGHRRQPLTYRMYLRPTDVNPAPMHSARTGFEGDRQTIVAYVERYTTSLPIEHLVFELMVSTANDFKACLRYVAEDIAPVLRSHRGSNRPLLRYALRCVGWTTP